ARQDFSLARRDISLATVKLHRSIKAAIKEEVDHEEGQGKAGTPSSKCCTWEHPCSWAECTKGQFSLTADDILSSWSNDPTTEKQSRETVVV
ncbi:hypothetical protein Tco_0718524, partial [Tanacetum coccineum]